MDLAKKILGKDLFQITKEDLEEYFSIPREETSVLEFKSGQIKINAIFKEICAFLNTDGGLIIIGSPKERKVPKSGKFLRRICQGTLIPSSFRDKNWIESLIAANIVPYPQGLRINEIRKEEGNYFVIEVPKSQKPPHQFLNDGRYYIRLEKEAKPAPHGIVETLFFKQVKAQLRADVSIDNMEDKADTFNKIYVDIRNLSSVPAKQVSYMIRVFNIEEIRQDGNSLTKPFKGNNGNFELQGVFEDSLMDEKTFPIRFNVMNKQEPFIVSVMAWNREAGIFKNHGLFDPVNCQFIETYKTGDREEKSLEQLYTTLQDIRNNLS
ncbi:MAG: ATP-binding protein [Bacteroidales bacterium]|nr:ATP-binding protein [Bacteroidales bacterium]